VSIKSVSLISSLKQKPSRYYHSESCPKREGIVHILGKMDLSRVKIRLDNIRDKATKSVSFEPTETPVRMQEHYLSPTMSCLEDMDSSYPLIPSENDLMDKWNIYGYDESTQDFQALEGNLMFCSSSVIKMEDKYAFNLTVLPYFMTSIKKFKGSRDEEIRFTEKLSEERNKILVKTKTQSILEGTEPYSIVLIDGPLIGGMASSYMTAMDNKLRDRNCIPLYFVKNSDSRLVIDSERNSKYSREFNSDFHWAAHCLKEGTRSAFFRYTDRHKNENSKVFAYVKALAGFAERVEMHSLTYEKYHSLLSPLMNLIAYLYIVQGDFSNPQVRPVVIAEKYAREGLRILNIPVLLFRLGFRPTVNQVRFG